MEHPLRWRHARLQENLQGHDENWSRQVVETLNEGKVIVDGVKFTISSNLISVATGMALDGIKHSRYVRNSLEDIKKCMEPVEMKKLIKIKSDYL